jgi:hypothetical protein
MAPGLGSLFCEFEGQPEEGRACQAVLGPLGAMARGGERGLDGVGGAQICTQCSAGKA